MKNYKQDFIDFALSYQALQFGEFTLKSNRVSPYFFNAGMFNTGEALSKLGQFYAAAINDAGIDFDMLFGPAYKGIPLVCSSVCALSQLFNINVPYAFDRKETKAYGDKGSIVGAALNNRVLIVDDVITAGTAIRHTMSLIEKANAMPAGIVIMLDRQEKGTGNISAIQEIEQNYKIPVISIINVDDLLSYIQNNNTLIDYYDKICLYREQYGV